MKRIIVNADDFGINERATLEIEKAIESGSVSSTTIMANGACLNEVASFAQAHPEVSFGAHICISEFGSITKSPVLKKYGIMDDRNQFVKYAVFNLRRFPQELLDAISDEIHAQIKILKSLAIPLSHCDSHHHSHTIYGLHKVFRDAVKEEGFDKMRIAREVATYTLFRHPIYAQKQLFINRFYKKNFTTTDYFCSYAEYMSSKGNDCDGIIELMCHPGHDHFADEYKMVMDKKAIANKDVKLISYLEL